MKAKRNGHLTFKLVIDRLGIRILCVFVVAGFVPGLNAEALHRCSSLVL